MSSTAGKADAIGTMDEIADVKAQIKASVTTIAGYDADYRNTDFAEMRKELLQTITARSTDLTALRQRLRDLETPQDLVVTAPAGI